MYDQVKNELPKNYQHDDLSASARVYDVDGRESLDQRRVPHTVKKPSEVLEHVGGLPAERTMSSISLSRPQQLVRIGSSEDDSLRSVATETAESKEKVVFDVAPACQPSKSTVSLRQLAHVWSSRSAPAQTNTMSDASRWPSARDDLPEPESGFEYPEGGLEANLVVLGAFSGMFAAFGLMNTMGTLQAYTTTHQLSDYSESVAGWIFSLYIFVAFFGGIQVGPAFDRWGPRGLVAAGGICLVVGEVALANATTFAHFIVSLSLLCGMGTTLIITPCISVIAHWFSRRRGTMTGIAATGGSIGGVLFPLILPSLFDTIGWTWAMRSMALVDLIACLVAFILLRARLPPKRGTSVRPDFTIFRNVAFALTTAGVFTMEFGLFVPLTYISTWAIGAGLGSPDHDAAFPFRILAVLNGASFFGRWLPGIAADRWGRFNTLAASIAGSLIFLLATWLPAILLPGGGGLVGAVGVPPSTSGGGTGTLITALSILFAIGFGFFFGAGISLTPVCVGELCDPREYGRWFATCYSIVSFGCLTGVPIAGAVLGDGGTRGWASLVAWTSACYAVSLTCFVAARVTRGGWQFRTIV